MSGRSGPGVRAGAGLVRQYRHSRPPPVPARRRLAVFPLRLGRRCRQPHLRRPPAHRRRPGLSGGRRASHRGRARRGRGVCAEAVDSAHGQRLCGRPVAAPRPSAGQSRRRLPLCAPRLCRHGLAARRPAARLGRLAALHAGLERRGGRRHGSPAGQRRGVVSAQLRPCAGRHLPFGLSRCGGGNVLRHGLAQRRAGGRMALRLQLVAPRPDALRQGRLQYAGSQARQSQQLIALVSRCRPLPPRLAHSDRPRPRGAVGHARRHAPGLRDARHRPLRRQGGQRQRP